MVWLAEQIKYAFIALMWFIAFCILMSAVLWFVFSTWAERIFIFACFTAILSIFAYFKHRNREIIYVNESSPTLAGSEQKTGQKGDSKPVQKPEEVKTASPQKAYVSDSELSNIHHILKVLNNSGAFKENIDVGALLNKDASEFENVVDYSKHNSGKNQTLNIAKSGNKMETNLQQDENGEETK